MERPKLTEAGLAYAAKIEERSKPTREEFIRDAVVSYVKMGLPESSARATATALWRRQERNERDLKAFRNRL